MCPSLIRSKCCEHLGSGLHSRAAFLDRETAKANPLVAEIRDAIDRLKEYRTALIAAAVTGKIDVRGEAI